MFLYAITDSRQLASGLAGRISGLLRLAEQWALGGVDAIQIREKDLEAGALEALTTKVLKIVEGSRSRVYVNMRVDVAIATGAEVHLPGGSLLPSEVRGIFSEAGMPAPQISVACHSVADVQLAAAGGATMALLAPIFCKQIPAEEIPEQRTTFLGLGIHVLREACKAASPGSLSFPVVALGGITEENARECVNAGAAGVAGIRLFRDGGWRGLVARPN